MVVPENLKLFLLVSLGAILGSNIRFYIYERLGKIFFVSKYLRIVFINNFASFLLGFFYSFLIKSYANPLQYTNYLLLLVSIGFLGSLSTFSSFIYDLFDLLSQNKYFTAINLTIFSLVFGLGFLYLGFVLADL